MNAKSMKSGKPERKSREAQAQEERERVVLAIARRCFGVETLAPQGSDALDFHNVAVWSMRDALTEAYAAGGSGSGVVRSEPQKPKSRKEKGQEERKRGLVAVVDALVDARTTKGGGLEAEAVGVALVAAYEAGRAVGKVAKRRPRRKPEE